MKRLMKRVVADADSTGSTRASRTYLQEGVCPRSWHSTALYPAAGGHVGCSLMRSLGSGYACRHVADGHIIHTRRSMAMSGSQE